MSEINRESKTVPSEPTVRVFLNGRSYESSSVCYSAAHVVATLRPVGAS